jgi:hypothetical protein
MHITDEQRNAFGDWLRQKIGRYACPLCQSNRWSIAVELLILHPDEALNEPASPTPAMVQVVCENCARVELFDVRRISAWPSPVQDASHTLLM